MLELYSLWSGFGAETKAALIGAVSTLAVGFVGFGGLILQSWWQGKQSRQAIADNESRRLKTALYEDALLICRDVADQSIELSNALLMMSLQIEFAAKASASGQPYDLPTARVPMLLEKYGKFSNATLRFVFLIENRRFIDPRILIFRTAMSVALHDTGKLMHSAQFVDLFPAIPTQLPDGSIFPYSPPTLERAAVIKEFCESCISSLNDAIMYTEDFTVELQNLLLADLFGHKVAHRVPLDPSKRVITFEHWEELEIWFRQSTDWGREMQRIEAEAAMRFPPNPPPSPPA